MLSCILYPACNYQLSGSASVKVPCNACVTRCVHVQVRLRDVFDRYDTNRSGRLEMREVGRLIRDLVPDASDADIRYILVRSRLASIWLWLDTLNEV